MKLQKVSSLAELERKAKRDEAYEEVAINSANNIGGYARTLQEAMHWLRLSAMETSEAGVLDEINFVI